MKLQGRRVPVLMTAEYINKFKTAAVELIDKHILSVRLHSRGGSLIWNSLPHRELPDLFDCIRSDEDVRVVVLTGTGEHFIELESSFEEAIACGEWSAATMEAGTYEARRILDSLLSIRVPIIAAINGPVTVHAELALLSDIVICAEDTYFQDAAHVPCGLVPGDGVQVVWPMLIGLNRARYFLMTGAMIPAAEAKALGIVSEVVSRQALPIRAMEHARRLAVCNPVFLRSARDVLTRPLRRAIELDLDYGLAAEAVSSLAGKEWQGPYAPAPISPPSS
jgi:enoyl-CoA hydratase/carnithine racemase